MVCNTSSLFGLCGEGASRKQVMMSDKTCPGPVVEFSELLKESGVCNDADWMAIILFVRNLLTRLTVYTDEKKAEIQREICAQLAKRDFSDDQYEAVLAMLDAYIMQSIATLELEEALTREKRSATELLNEMTEIIVSMQGTHQNHDRKLNEFREQTVEVIEAGTKKSLIVSQVREMFQDLIVEFKEEARALNEKALQLEQTANFDPLLTELHNRRAMDTFLRAAVKEASDENAALSLMMIDVDHFKRVNDTYGHQAGDDVLRALARIITAHAVQYSGFSARYGGEELVVVVKDLNMSRTAIKAEAVRADVENYDFRVRTEGQLSDTPLKFTISVGVSELLPGWGASDLVAAADKALYQAKNTGRNRVCMAPLI